MYIHVFHTGRTSFYVLLGACFSGMVINEVYLFRPWLQPKEIALVRWSLLAGFSALIFWIGCRSNRTQVMRPGIGGKQVMGAPNTIYFIPLQYWAFVYFGIIGSGITAWTLQEAARH